MVSSPCVNGPGPDAAMCYKARKCSQQLNQPARSEATALPEPTRTWFRGGHYRTVAAKAARSRARVGAGLLGLGRTWRDQVLLWDEDALYVYGADDLGDGPSPYRRFPPEHNRSNYRGEGLFPR